jgi:hypothetical protein
MGKKLRWTRSFNTSWMPMVAAFRRSPPAGAIIENPDIEVITLWTPSASSSKLRCTALDPPNTTDMPKPAEKPAEFQKPSRRGLAGRAGTIMISNI